MFKKRPKCSKLDQLLSKNVQKTTKMFKNQPKCSKLDQLLSKNVQKATKMFIIWPIIKQKCSKSGQNVQN